jgi:hypothetical protein
VISFGRDARGCNSCSMLVISVFLFRFSHSSASSLDFLSEIQDRAGSRKKLVLSLIPIRKHVTFWRLGLCSTETLEKLSGG